MPESAVFLLVEDDESDVLLLKRAFEKARILNRLVLVKNGVEAIAYLDGAGRYRDRKAFPLPKLILLDLKLPGLDGFEVLKWIREHPDFKTMRVIVLTSSDSIRDINRAYQAGANSFLVKPVAFEDLVHLVQAIKGYWIWIDKAPESLRSAEHKVPGLGC